MLLRAGNRRLRLSLHTLNCVTRLSVHIRPPNTLARFLSGYVLTLEVMTIEIGFSSWKSVQRCSVETEESEVQPAELIETVTMTQVRLHARRGSKPFRGLEKAGAFNIRS